MTERITISSRALPLTKLASPAYELLVSYVQSSGGGKSLLAKGKVREAQAYNAFFDKEGVMNQEKFEAWVGGIVEAAMEGKTT